MIKDTAYNLELRLQRIDDKLAGLSTNRSNVLATDVDLKNERAVTEQCLRVCEDARSYLDTLSTRDPSLLQVSTEDTTAKTLREVFEAQLLTRQALEENRNTFVKIISRLRARLESTLSDGDPCDRLRLQEDIKTSKQCLEVCNMASSQVSQQKIHIVGEVVADGDSDQVVVTTLADLFDVKKATSKGRSAQLIGSMNDETLRHLSENRYSSRFGAFTSNVGTMRDATGLSSSEDKRKVTFSVPKQTDKGNSSPVPGGKENLPSSNETRKRAGYHN